MRQDKLSIEELTWKPSSSQPEILKDISTDFLKGGFYGILGPNGSGKTSLMRHILRLLESEYGRLTLLGEELKDYPRRDLAKEIAFVPQNTNIDVGFTAYDIVMMGRAPHQKRFATSTEHDKKIVLDAMRRSNCLHLADKMFSTLSGGEAQRVITARALAQETPWLILDEPIAHLDVRYQVELMKQLRECNEQKNISILAVLHDINLAYEYCKEIILMKNGRVIASGTSKEVMTLENLQKVYDIEFYMVAHPKGEGNCFIPK